MYNKILQTPRQFYTMCDRDCDWRILITPWNFFNRLENPLSDKVKCSYWFKHIYRMKWPREWQRQHVRYNTWQGDFKFIQSKNHMMNLFRRNRFLEFYLLSTKWNPWKCLFSSLNEVSDRYTFVTNENKKSSSELITSCYINYIFHSSCCSLFVDVASKGIPCIINWH